VLSPTLFRFLYNLSVVLYRAVVELFSRLWDTSCCFC